MFKKYLLRGFKCVDQTFQLRQRETFSSRKVLLLKYFGNDKNIKDTIGCIEKNLKKNNLTLPRKLQIRQRESEADEKFRIRSRYTKESLKKALKCTPCPITTVR